MKEIKEKYDVIVVGGGHAGAEAALASARMGTCTLLVTSSISAIAKMPCNPAIGGLAKSHLVYELDALGGEMGKNADATALQSKILNSSRGPAVQATRAQCAKKEYSERMQSVILSQDNLDVLEDSVTDLLVEDIPHSPQQSATPNFASTTVESQLYNPSNTNITSGNSAPIPAQSHTSHITEFHSSPASCTAKSQSTAIFLGSQTHDPIIPVSKTASITKSEAEPIAADSPTSPIATVSKDASITKPETEPIAAESESTKLQAAPCADAAKESSGNNLSMCPSAQDQNFVKMADRSSVSSPVDCSSPCNVAAGCKEKSTVAEKIKLSATATTRRSTPINSQTPHSASPVTAGAPDTPQPNLNFSCAPASMRAAWAESPRHSAANPTGKAISGIKTASGKLIKCKCTIITAGTSLEGKIWIGKESTESGGDGRKAENELANTLQSLGFELIRLKTGTPPRLKASSCDFSKCLEQPGDTPRPLFHVEQSEDCTAHCSTWNNKNVSNFAGNNENVPDSSWNNENVSNSTGNNENVSNSSGNNENVSNFAGNNENASDSSGNNKNVSNSTGNNGKSSESGFKQSKTENLAKTDENCEHAKISANNDDLKTQGIINIPKANSGGINDKRDMLEMNGQRIQSLKNAPEVDCRKTSENKTSTIQHVNCHQISNETISPVASCQQPLCKKKLPKLSTQPAQFDRKLQEVCNQQTPGANKLPEMSCWQTHTNPKTHKIIRNNLERSALYGGAITGTGVRYCPSIEDKIVRFEGVESHHVMLEPEDSEGETIYPNGLSCCLPIDAQIEMVHSVAGLEHAEFTAYAYAIEYYAINPIQLKHSLESKHVSGLFFAGQVNGTTGYEEAAAQGIVAGINASLESNGRSPMQITRHDAYIGVMIDDLVTKGVDEPYRMFTSRAERRLLLRQDNAIYRMHGFAKVANILSTEKLNEIEAVKEALEKAVSAPPDSHDADISNLLDFSKLKYITKERIMEELYIMRHYAPYIEQEEKAAKQAIKDENIKIPLWLDYDKCTALRFESREKLKRYRPENLFQASRIPGVNPSDTALLSIIIKRGKH